MHLATFRITGTKAYESITNMVDVDVELWCNEHCDLLHIKGADVDTTLEAVREQVGIRDSIGHDEEVVAITGDCLRQHEEGLVEDYLQANDCLFLPPLWYTESAKIVRVLALDPASLSSCYQDMIADGLSVTVDSKRSVDTVTEETPLVTVQDTLPTLTERQQTVLQTAIDAGYYEIPRESKTSEIADEVGLARRTTEEHLRRGERKIITGLFKLF